MTDPAMREMLLVIREETGNGELDFFFIQRQTNWFHQKGRIPLKGFDSSLERVCVETRAMWV